MTKMATSTENLLQELRGLINEAIIPEDLQSTPWNDFVVEMLSHEMTTRHLRMNTTKVWEAYARKWRELLPDLQASQSWPVYCGSYPEGMPNAGDLDTMFVASWTVTYEHNGKMVDNVDQLPFVTTSDCHPGFIKIIVPLATRKVYDFKDYQIRKIGRHFYLSSMGFLRTMQEWGTTGSNFDVHGPALTLSATADTSYDVVHAIRCTQWPTFAQDVFNRSNIPDGLAEKLKSSSLYAVAIGHALSKDADVEWRLSFSEAEKCLVENWNETQFNCYFLLKNFKMIHLKNPDIVCSYFMKTVIFWMSDVLPKESWDPSRLIELLYQSLFILQSMYKKCCLPNYFIPQNNMIAHKKKKDCLALADTIHSILTSGQMKEIIAELLCEEELEIVHQVMNSVPRHIPVQSCRKLCTLVRQYCQSTVSFSEALLRNEADILSSLTVMMTIWNKTQCKAMEAILTKLPELISPANVNVFHTMITRQLADSYHSLPTRDSKKRAERLYKESLSLVYPCGFDDEGLSGNIQLALFYYLEGNNEKAVTVLHDFIPMIVKAVKINRVERYILIAFPPSLKERFVRDEFLYREVSALKAEFPITINIIVVGLYILIQSNIEMSSKESLDGVTRFFMLLKACGNQLTTQNSYEAWMTIIKGVQSILEDNSNPFLCTLEPRSKPPPLTRNQKLKHFWEDS